MRLELLWGRVRRWLLRLLRPGYVRRQSERRLGQCESCPGRVQGCTGEVIDSRDLKFFRNVCGYSFRPDEDRFRWRGHLGFARPGLAELLLATVLFLLLLAGLAGLVYLDAVYSLHLPQWPIWIASSLLTAGWLLIVWFFRDPPRRIPDDPTVLVSPADGTITDVGEVSDPDFPGGKAFRIGIFLSIFNVHVNRSPRAAKVTALRYFPGRFRNAMSKECATENEQLWIDLIDVQLAIPLRVKQIAGAIARRIVCWLKPGDTLETGERFGMIKVGSRTELYLPTDIPFKIAVRVGMKVKGGSTVLLRFHAATVQERLKPSSSIVQI
ncbi:MAG TPA: phosphatidylserine decarboxylase [Gemmatales bacterium]|nr:phosphatidylserine decarboxylase [Gemmatales bacterium]